MQFSFISFIKKILTENFLRKSNLFRKQIKLTFAGVIFSRRNLKISMTTSFRKQKKKKMVFTVVIFLRRDLKFSRRSTSFKKHVKVAFAGVIFSRRNLEFSSKKWFRNDLFYLQAPRLMSKYWLIDFNGMSNSPGVFYVVSNSTDKNQCLKETCR